VLEESSASGLRLSVPPSKLSALELVLAGAHTDDPAQLSALKETAQLLYVGAEAMIVADYDHPPRLLSRCKDSLYALGCKRERSLAQNVNLGAECPQNVGLVQMVGRRDYDCVEPILLEQLFHVREYIGNTESLRESARH
jgi:hypothetical protein